MVFNWLGGDKRKKKSVNEDDSLQSSTFVGSDGRTYQLVAPPDQPREPDSADLKLRGQCKQELIDEVKRLRRPPWQEQDSSLDPIDDLEDYYMHDFRLPPDEWDRIQAAARDEVADLEALKPGLGPEFEARVAKRRQLADGATAEELRWLKHHAYVRGIAALRGAGRGGEVDALNGAGAAPRGDSVYSTQAGERRRAYLESKGVPLDAIPAELVDMTPGDFVTAGVAAGNACGQASLAGHAGGSAEEADVSSSSEWDMAWHAPGYKRHPEVAAAVAGAFAATMGGGLVGDNGSLLAYYGSPGGDDLLALGTASQAARLARRQGGGGASGSSSDKDTWGEGGQAGAVSEDGTGAQAFTKQHLLQLERQRRLVEQQRAQQQVFWAGFALSLGGAGLRWLRQQRRRQGGGAGAGAAAPV